MAIGLFWEMYARNIFSSRFFFSLLDSAPRTWLKLGFIFLFALAGAQAIGLQGRSTEESGHGYAAREPAPGVGDRDRLPERPIEKSDLTTRNHNFSFLGKKENAELFREFCLPPRNIARSCFAVLWHFQWMHYKPSSAALHQSQHFLVSFFFVFGTCHLFKGVVHRCRGGCGENQTQAKNANSDPNDISCSFGPCSCDGKSINTIARARDKGRACCSRNASS